MSSIEHRLATLHIELGGPPQPAAAYLPAKQSGNLIYVSGQDCRVDGVLKYEGKVGSDLTVEEGYDAARQAAINALAVLKAWVGDLDRVKQIVKLLGFVNSAGGFVEQPYVINGASHLFEEIWGERGKHARSAIAASELPFNTPVEIEIIVEI
ncbi:MAG: RidA family protein [Spirochaetales bacterium]|nr:RidA family protein [Spirochaetales bacterium]